MIRDPNNETDAKAAAPAGNPTAQNEAAASGNKSTSRLLPLSTSTSASSRSSTAVAPWMRLSKDPRIVRVSRAFGGKDRHSKVCTVRGLRDRRVRLSVPTAIQLYDLQDRLGLNQPSKVVDWLLDAAKDDIDQLPPLPMLPPAPGSYGGGGLMNHPHHHHQSSLLNSIASDQNRGFGSDIWRSSTNEEADNDGEDSEEEDRRRRGGDAVVVGHGGSSSSNNNFLMTRNSTNHPLFFPGLLNSSTNAMPNYGFHNWDNNENHDHHQSSSNYGFTSHPTTDLHNFNVAASSLPSTLSLSTGTTTQSYFPSHDAAAEFSQHMQSPHHQNLMANNSSGVYPNSQSSMQRATPQNLLSMITKLGHQQPNKDQQEPPST